ncbi:MAG: hypothetical protein RI920_2068 [Pseudomonadota bacterium]
MSATTLLLAIEDAGVGVMTLTEGLQDDELVGSRLTRAETIRHLLLLTEAAKGLPDVMRAGMPEVDWAGLSAAEQALSGPRGPAQDEALLLGAKALVPTALMWLRVYRTQHPDWFSLSPA